MDYKQKFKDYVQRYIKRDGIDKLMTALDSTDFYTAPASTRYHDAFEGGLVYHSVKVFEQLLASHPQNTSLESIAIVGLFHDMCKMGYYTIEMRNKKIDGQWQSVPFYTVNDMYPFGHGEKSVDLLRDFLELTEEEKMAIRWHMGGYEAKENYNYLSKAYLQYPLALYTHLADMKATYLDGKYEEK